MYILGRSIYPAFRQILALCNPHDMERMHIKQVAAGDDRDEAQ